MPTVTLSESQTWILPVGGEVTLVLDGAGGGGGGSIGIFNNIYRSDGSPGEAGAASSYSINGVTLANAGGGGGGGGGRFDPHTTTFFNGAPGANTGNGQGRFGGAGGNPGVVGRGGHGGRGHQTTQVLNLTVGTRIVVGLGDGGRGGSRGLFPTGRNTGVSGLPGQGAVLTITYPDLGNQDGSVSAEAGAPTLAVGGTDEALDVLTGAVAAASGAPDLAFAGQAPGNYLYQQIVDAGTPNRLSVPGLEFYTFPINLRIDNDLVEVPPVFFENVQIFTGGSLRINLTNSMTLSGGTAADTRFNDMTLANGYIEFNWNDGDIVLRRQLADRIGAGGAHITRTTEWAADADAGAAFAALQALSSNPSLQITVSNGLPPRPVNQFGSISIEAGTPDLDFSGDEVRDEILAGTVDAEAGAPSLSVQGEEDPDDAQAGSISIEAGTPVVSTAGLEDPDDPQAGDIDIEAGAPDLSIVSTVIDVLEPVDGSVSIQGGAPALSVGGLVEDDDNLDAALPIQGGEPSLSVGGREGADVSVTGEIAATAGAPDLAFAGVVETDEILTPDIDAEAGEPTLMIGGTVAPDRPLIGTPIEAEAGVPAFVTLAGVLADIVPVDAFIEAEAGAPTLSVGGVQLDDNPLDGLIFTRAGQPLLSLRGTQTDDEPLEAAIAAISGAAALTVAGEVADVDTFDAVAGQPVSQRISRPRTFRAMLGPRIAGVDIAGINPIGRRRDFMHGFTRPQSPPDSQPGIMGAGRIFDYDMRVMGMDPEGEGEYRIGDVQSWSATFDLAMILVSHLDRHGNDHTDYLANNVSSGAHMALVVDGAQWVEWRISETFDHDHHTAFSVTRVENKTPENARLPDADTQVQLWFSQPTRGISGFSQAVVCIYKRQVLMPAMDDRPADALYNVSTGLLERVNEMTPLDLNGWSQPGMIPPDTSPSQPLWVRKASVVTDDPTEQIDSTDWSAVIHDTGGGIDFRRLDLWQRADQRPAGPSTQARFDFLTGLLTFTGAGRGNWQLDIDGTNAQDGHALWLAHAVATKDQTGPNLDTIDPAEWSIGQIAEDGRYATIEADLFMRVRNPPATGGAPPPRPTADSYDFDSATFTNLTPGWRPTQFLESELDPSDLVFCCTTTLRDDGNGETTNIVFSAPRSCRGVIDIDIMYGKFTPGVQPATPQPHSASAANPRGWYDTEMDIPASEVGLAWQVVRYLEAMGDANVRWRYDAPTRTLFAPREADVWLRLQNVSPNTAAPAAPTADYYDFLTGTFQGLTAGWRQQAYLEDELDPDDLVFCTTLSLLDNGYGRDTTLAFRAPLNCRGVIEIDLLYGRFREGFSPGTPNPTPHSVIPLNWYPRINDVPANRIGLNWEMIRRLKRVGTGGLQWVYDDPYIVEGIDGRYSESVFTLTDTKTKPALINPSREPADHVRIDDYVPANQGYVIHDDPPDITLTMPYRWQSTRRRERADQRWGPFQTWNPDGWQGDSARLTGGATRYFSGNGLQTQNVGEGQWSARIPGGWWTRRGVEMAQITDLYVSLRFYPNASFRASGILHIRTAQEEMDFLLDHVDEIFEIGVYQQSVSTTEWVIYECYAMTVGQTRVRFQLRNPRVGPRAALNSVNPALVIGGIAVQYSLVPIPIVDEEGIEDRIRTNLLSNLPPIMTP